MNESKGVGVVAVVGVGIGISVVLKANKTINGNVKHREEWWFENRTP